MGHLGLRGPGGCPGSQESIWSSGGLAWRWVLKPQTNPFKETETLTCDAVTWMSLPWSASSAAAPPPNFAWSPGLVGRRPRMPTSSPLPPFAGLGFGQSENSPVWVVSQLSPVHRPQAQESNYENLNQMSPRGPPAAVCSL